MKYKIGDWLKIVTLNSKNGKLNGKIGHVFQVNHLTSSKFYQATPDTNTTGSCWPEECVTQAEQYEIPEKYRINSDTFPIY